MPDLTIETRAICTKFVDSIDYDVESECVWQEDYGCVQKEEGVCPECGAPTTYIRVAV